MKIFWKIFALSFVLFIGIVLLIFYFILSQQILEAEKYTIEENRVIGTILSKEIEKDYLESRWPFASLNTIVERGDFLFWWVVRNDGIIHLADKAPFMKTQAHQYFPQLAEMRIEKNIFLNPKQNYGIVVLPFKVGKNEWTFWLGFSLKEVLTIKKRLIFADVIIFLLALAIFSIMLLLSTTYLTRPIKALITSATMIGKGELGHRAEVKAADELGQLAQAFNDMTADLQKSDARLRAILTAADNVSFIITGLEGTEYRILEMSPGAERIFGYRGEEVMGKPVAVLHFPEDMSRFPEAMEPGRQEKTGFTQESMLVRKSGESFPALFSSYPIADTEGNIIAILWVAIDITQRKQIEEALRESEEKYRQLVSQIPAVVFKGYSDWSVDCFDDKVEVLTGYSKEDFNSRRIKWCDLIPPEDLDYVQGVFIEALKSSRSYVREHRLRRKSGEIIWVQCQGQIFCDAAGNVDYISGVTFDITARRLMEEALRQSENRLAEAQRLAHLGNWDWHIQNNELWWSDEIYRTFGLTPQEFGATYEAFLNSVHADDREMVKHAVDQALHHGAPYRIDHRIVLPDGSERFVHEQAEVFFDENGQPLRMVGTVQDITERRKYEEERLMFSKLESLGLLAGGIAHDFNNILTVIIGNISLAMLDLPMEDRGRKRLTEAERACLQAQTLAQQMLTFARGGAPVKELVSITEILYESANFACRGSKVRCEFDLPDNLWVVEADPGQISQVFQNLIINAIQAMPTGGTIKAQGENLILEAENDLRLGAGRYIKISIQDQGLGMPVDYLSRIFDPYFTTKQEGSGLGLATAYSIVRNHKGYISVESELGVGTTFNIYLPAVELEIIPKPEAERELLAGTGKILVMDDEEMVREVLDKMLLTLGYAANFAKEGGEAIEMFAMAQKSGQPFDAVILDLTVPGGMGGKETIENLLKIDPQVKAIVSSGYSDDPIMADFQKYGFSGVIAKPYRVLELNKILNELIINKT